MDWFGVSLILVAGTVLVGAALQADRLRSRARTAALKRPPKRPIPGYSPAEPPAYVTTEQAQRRLDGRAEPGLSAPARAEIQAQLDVAAAIDSGVPEAFVTDAATGWAVAEKPLVVVLADPVSTIRELLPLLDLAKRAARPLVLAAPEFTGDTLEVLAANSIQGKLQCLPVVTDAAQSRRVSELAAAEQLPRADLQAGWVPQTALGSLDRWVASRNRSWMI